MAAERKNKTGEEMQQEVLTKIAAFSENNKQNALRIHQLITEANPSLCPRLWYGMPGYAASKDSAVLVFFREDLYMTFGLTENAHFDAPSPSDGGLMPCAWFFRELDDEAEQKITAIVRSATS